jgi:hypothetical protein
MDASSVLRLHHPGDRGVGEVAEAVEIGGNADVFPFLIFSRPRGPTWPTRPMITSPTSAGSIPARAMAALAAVAPSSNPGTSLKTPPKLPTNARAPSTGTALS